MNLLRVADPAVLLPLVLAVLPWWPRTRATVAYPWLPLVPRDAAARWLDASLRLLASLAIVLVVIAIAGPYRAEHAVERIGRGAEIALLIDRSRSMDQAFISAQAVTSDAMRNQLMLGTPAHGRQTDRPSKGQEARRILADFVARRREDSFATMFFSTLPIPVHDFTHKDEVVQAAITAGAVGRGLAETDIGLALLRALDWFRDRPYRGSRIVLLVSDGGDHLDPDTRAEVAQRMRERRVALYWIYIRSPRSPRLADDAQVDERYADTVPEHFLHRFFGSIGTPYRAYEADDPKELERAIADLDRLEKLPIATVETIARRDLADVAYAAALGAVLALLAAQSLVLRRWA